MGTTPKIPMRVYPKGSAGFQPAAFGILPEAWARAECNPTPSPARRHQDAGRMPADAGKMPALPFGTTHRP